jgi:lipopolysaccharide transport system ATP-binding protein
MPAITRLCPRTILLDEGHMLQDGPSHQVVAVYLDSGLGTTAMREWPDLAKAPGNEVVRLCAVRVRTEDGQSTDAVDIRQPVGIELEYEVLEPGHALLPHFTLYNQEGVFAFASYDLDPAWRGRPRPVGRYVSTGWIPGNMLAEGLMFIGPAMASIEPRILYFYERDAVAFQVIDTLDGNSARGDFRGPVPGVVRPLLEWRTRFSPNGCEIPVTVTEQAGGNDEQPLYLRNLSTGT